MTHPNQKTDAEWKTLLEKKKKAGLAEPMAFEVTRHEATERAFSGKYADNKQSGVYACVCCGKDLFDSATKYDSGTGSGGHQSGRHAVDQTHRSALRRLRRPLGTRVSRRPCAHRAALLHEFGVFGLQTSR